MAGMETLVAVLILGIGIAVTWLNFRMYRALMRFVEVARRWADADIRLKRAQAQVSVSDPKGWLLDLLRRLGMEPASIVDGPRPFQWHHPQMGSLEGLLAVLEDGRRVIVTHLSPSVFRHIWKQAQRLPDFTLLPPYHRTKWREIGLYNGGEFVDREYGVVSGFPPQTPLYLAVVHPK